MRQACSAPPLGRTYAANIGAPDYSSISNPLIAVNRREYRIRRLSVRLQSAKGRHGESAPNEKQVLRWQTFAFPQGPLDARAAHLACSNHFIGDEDIKGPSSAEEWKAAYRIVWHVMGLPRALPPP
jgi:hypothetical protein